MLLILPWKSSASSIGVGSTTPDDATTSNDGSSASLKNILLVPDRRDGAARGCGRDDDGRPGDGTMYAVAAKLPAMPMDTTILAMFFIALGCWGGALSRVMVIVCGAGINSNKIYGNDGTFILARVMMMWFVVGHARHDPTPQLEWARRTTIYTLTYYRAYSLSKSNTYLHRRERDFPHSTGMTSFFDHVQESSP